jgi:proteasome accessory factor B
MSASSKTSHGKSPSKARKGASRAKKNGAPRQDRSKRLLDLVMLLLRARIPVAFRDIREQFTSYQTENVEAGLRAFERDKADLLELGVPIRYITPDEDDAVEEGGYVIDLKKYRLPEVHLTPEEISALVLATSVARAVPGAEYAKICDLAVRKLAFDFPEPDTPLEWPPPGDFGRDAAPVLVHFPEGQEPRAMGDRFSQLESATRNRKRVTMRYQNASTGYVQTRELDPYGLYYRDKSWLVVGYCHLRKDIRSFRLDRIAALKLAPKPKSPDFKRPEDFDVRAYAARSPWTFSPSEAEEIEIELRHEALSTANEDFGNDAVREDAENDCVRIRFKSGNIDYVVSRVLAAKGGIRVLQGDRVMAALRTELQAIEELYQ